MFPVYLETTAKFDRDIRWPRVFYCGVSTQIERDTVAAKVRQFTVFMENKAGRLLDLVKLFAEHNVHIIALTILDTADAAMVRLIVDDPSRARGILLEHTLAFTECNIVVVELPNSAEDLLPLLSALLQAECNIHFTYPFLIRPRGKAAMALHVEDEDCASQVLHQNDFKLLSQRDISR